MTFTEHSVHAHAGRLLLAMSAAVALLVASPAAAQEPPPQWTVGWGGSWVSYSPFLEAEGELLTSDIGLESGLGGTLFADRWLNRWVAVHLDGIYHHGRIRLPDESPSAYAWAVNAGALVRPFASRLLPAAPYLFGTGGLISYGPGGPSRGVTDGVVFDSDRTEQFLIQAGAGVDLLLLETWEQNTLGVRIEVARMMPWGRPFAFEEQGQPGSHGFWRFTLGLTAAVLPY